MDEEMEKQLNELVSVVLQNYYNYLNLNPIDVEIVLAESVSDIYMQKRPELFEGDNVVSPEVVNKNRGLTIPPKTIDGTFTIAINKEYFLNAVKNKDWQWAGTITHEMTHVFDYMNYVKINGLENYDIVQKELLHRPFVLWTEFHARATGYFFIRKFTFGGKYDDKNDKDQTDFILQNELQYQINWFSQQYEAANGNADIQLYEAMQFMGRYSIWEKLFPNVFNKRVRQQVFGSNPWMLDMYNFLIGHQTLEEANKDFDEMLNIIKTNFEGYDI